MSARANRCACHEVSGSSDACQWSSTGDGTRRVRVEYVPRQLRGTASAAGHACGLWSTAMVHPECLATLIHEWDHELEDYSPEPSPWVRRASARRRSAERVATQAGSALASLRAVGAVA